MTTVDYTKKTLHFGGKQLKNKDLTPPRVGPQFVKSQCCEEVHNDRETIVNTSSGSSPRCFTFITCRSLCTTSVRSHSFATTLTPHQVWDGMLGREFKLRWNQRRPPYRAIVPFRCPRKSTSWAGSASDSAYCTWKYAGHQTSNRWDMFLREFKITVE